MTKAARSFVKKEDRGNSSKGGIFGILAMRPWMRRLARRRRTPTVGGLLGAGRGQYRYKVRGYRISSIRRLHTCRLVSHRPKPVSTQATLKTGYAGLALIAAATLHRRRHHPRHRLLPLLLLLLRPLVSDACPSPAAVSLSLRRQRCSYS